MKVLVSGSRGYIGSVLVPMLVAQGHEVIGLDSDLYRACTFAGQLAEIPTIVKDVRDVTVQDVAGCEAIVHLAALSNDPLGDYDPQLTFDINVGGSLALAAAARQARVGRFVYASSCSVYGAAGEQFLSEDAPFNPVTPYAESKLRVERALARMADEHFCPVYLRAATAYGASARMRFDLVANNLTAWAFTTRQVYLKSDGEPWRPIVHVEDISAAYAAALVAPRELVWNQPFNVGLTTENYQVRDIATLVHQIVPGCQITFACDAAADKRCYRVDCNKIARTLHHFKPQWTARRGIEQLYQLFNGSTLTQQDFEGPTFKRIAHIQQLIQQGELGSDLRWRGSQNPYAERDVDEARNQTLPLL
jgi:nucleoside-diphosphate-sugar epimerase